MDQHPLYLAVGPGQERYYTPEPVAFSHKIADAMKSNANSVAAVTGARYMHLI